jgi:hypothetical protein
MHPSTRDWLSAGLLALALVVLILVVVAAGASSLPPAKV